MSKENNITRGGLAEKMAGFLPQAPEEVWDAVSAQVKNENHRRKTYIILAVAAGIALALTVGVSLFTDRVPDETAYLENGTASEPSITESEPEHLKESSLPELSSNKDISTKVKETDRMSRPEIKKKGFEKKLAKVVQEEYAKITKEADVVLAKSESTDVIFQQENSTLDTVALENQNRLVKINEDSLLKLLVLDVPEIEVEEQPGASEKGKWQIGAGLSPQISYRDVASTVMAQNIAANNSESAKMTYSGGVQVSYKQSDRLTLESGIYYNKMGVNIGDYHSFRNELFASSGDFYNDSPENLVSISNSMGTIVSEENVQFVSNSYRLQDRVDYQILTPEKMSIANTAVTAFSQSFEYIEIPFNLRYKLLDSSFELQLIGGLSTNFLVGNQVTAIAGEENLKIGVVQDIHVVNYSGNAGLGFVFDIMDNFSLSLEPRFRYYLHSINLETLPATRPYSFGFYTGVNYTF